MGIGTPKPAKRKLLSSLRTSMGLAAWNAQGSIGGRRIGSKALGGKIELIEDLQCPKKCHGQG